MRSQFHVFVQQQGHGNIPHRRLNSIVTGGVLLLLIPLVYSGGLRRPPHFDDAWLLSMSTWSWESVRSAFDPWHGWFYRPMQILEFMLAQKIFGQVLWGHRLVNMALFWLTCWLLFLFLRRVFTSAWTATGAAVLFAVYPGHREVVFYPCVSATILAGLFWLSGMLAFLNWQERRQARWYALMLLSALCAFLSKEDALGLPLALAALQWWLGKKPERRDWFGALPLLVFWLGCVALSYTAYQHHRTAGVVATGIRMPKPNALHWFALEGSLLWTIATNDPTVGHETYRMVGWALEKAVVVAVLCALLWWRGNSTMRFGLLWLIAATLPLVGAIGFYVFFSSRFWFLGAMAMLCIAGALWETWEHKAGTETLPYFQFVALVVGVAALLPMPAEIAGDVTCWVWLPFIVLTLIVNGGSRFMQQFHAGKSALTQSVQLPREWRGVLPFVLLAVVEFFFLRNVMWVELLILAIVLLAVWAGAERWWVAVVALMGMVPLSWGMAAAFLAAPILWRVRWFAYRPPMLPVVALVGIVWAVITFQGAARMFDHREKIAERFPQIYERMSW
ncbi:MAG: glycosyltransferase family 39 protein [Abditibacteriales bacterium]|nr:glycosyltransferase family 39 protein [Abditibacteriales bacterium]MDW8367468.1 glycosyltransferase family 39 protein [Abditibacteriales bacterium]